MWKRARRKVNGIPTPQMDAGGICVYAIGDVHGRIDLLTELCARIDADIARNEGRRWLQVFLGDYVDRGPDSNSVLELLVERSRSPDVVCLRGNHEAAFLRFLDAPDTLAQWIQFGGKPTLLSYGLTPPARIDRKQAARLAQELREAMPPSHLAFLQNLRTSFSVGRYFFVHAGVRPGVALDRQREDDLLWIRNEFLLSEDDFGKVVVHGHSPVREPEFLFNRINVDTGAYATGRLTCVRLIGDDATVL